jgi:hypothetical protein
MVGLDNLDVVIIAKHLGRPAKKRDEHVHSQARVG